MVYALVRHEYKGQTPPSAPSISAIGRTQGHCINVAIMVITWYIRELIALNCKREANRYCPQPAVDDRAGVMIELDDSVLGRLLFVALFVFVTLTPRNTLCQKRSPGSRIAEGEMRISMVSPDCRCGLAWRRDADGLLESYFVIGIEDLVDGQYSVCRTLPSTCVTGFVGEDGTVALLTILDTCRALTVYDCQANGEATVLASWSQGSSENDWMQHVRFFSIANDRHHLATLDDNLVTTVRRLDPDGSWTTHSEFRSGLFPRFSSDDRILLMSENSIRGDSPNLDSITLESIEGAIWCYDLTRDTLYEAVSSVGMKEYPQMASVDSPVFYLKESSDMNRNLWKFSVSEGETQVSFFDWPVQVADFVLSSDHAYCKLQDHGNSITSPAESWVRVDLE